jgi:two-component system response regulator RegA
MHPDAGNHLLLVDDDALFGEVLAGALTRRGYAVTNRQDVPAALRCLAVTQFANAVVDLRMPGSSGLTLIPALVRHCPGIRIVVLTGYASIATAVEAIKLGATQYLTKPVAVDAIIQALHAPPNPEQAVPAQRPTPDRLEWEYLQQVLLEHDGNIAATARSLGMHRRTLQRKLAKRPVRQ